MKYGYEKLGNIKPCSLTAIVGDAGSSVLLDIGINLAAQDYVVTYIVIGSAQQIANYQKINQDVFENNKNLKLNLFSKETIRNIHTAHTDIILVDGLDDAEQPFRFDSIASIWATKQLSTKHKYAADVIIEASDHKGGIRLDIVKSRFVSGSIQLESHNGRYIEVDQNKPSCTEVYHLMVQDVAGKYREIGVAVNTREEADRFMADKKGRAYGVSEVFDNYENAISESSIHLVQTRY